MNNDIADFLFFVKELSVNIGERAILSSGEMKAKEYLKGVFNNLKKADSKIVCQEFEYDKEGVNGDLTNIVLVHPAKEQAHSIVSFGAHYDSVKGCSGAMDNASGVAMVLLLAKMFKDISFKNVELRFILFAGEEVGCVGSSYYVKSLNAREKEIYSAAVVFDIFISRYSEDASLVVNTQGKRVATGRIKGSAFKYLHGEENEAADNAVSKEIRASFNNLVNQLSNRVDNEKLCEKELVNNHGLANIDSGSVGKEINSDVGELKTLANNVGDLKTLTNNVGDLKTLVTYSGKSDKLLWCPRHYGYSDHASFHLASIDSANVTIRGSKATSGKLPAGYHSPQDVYEEDAFNVNLLGIAICVVKDAALSLANKIIEL